MPTTAISISAFKSSILPPSPPPPLSFPIPKTLTILRNFPLRPRFPFSISTSRNAPPRSKPSGEDAVLSEDDEWLQKLPEKKKPLYSHSLPCVEAWLRNLGFRQSRDDRAVWFVEKPDWHAQISLDATDLYIRYLKSGSENLDKDMERRFSYALSREDIENAILGGP